LHGIGVDVDEGGIDVNVGSSVGVRVCVKVGFIKVDAGSTTG
jgi:hypothetical protein